MKEYIPHITFTGFIALVAFLVSMIGPHYVTGKEYNRDRMVDRDEVAKLRTDISVIGSNVKFIKTFLEKRAASQK